MIHYFMNTNTGTVDTYENWMKVFLTVPEELWGGNSWCDAGLIEVIFDAESNDWKIK